jgi:deoxyxylulose-5-phosphate synthase
VLVAPADETELKLALDFAVTGRRCVCIRYPRDTVPQASSYTPILNQPFQLGKSITVIKNPASKAAIVSLGAMLSESLKAASILKCDGIDVDCINARFAKPLDDSLLLSQTGKAIITVEDHNISCGFGSALAELAAAKCPDAAGKIRILGVPNGLIGCASRSVQLADAGINAQTIAETVKHIINKKYINTSITVK